MASIAIMAPDGNQFVGFSHPGLTWRQIIKRVDARNTSELTREDPVCTADHNWPFRFDRIYAAKNAKWRSYDPDYFADWGV